MKSFKRSAVIITVLLFLCVAVYLNWSYNQKEADVLKEVNKAAEKDTTDPETKKEENETEEDAGLYYTVNDAESVSVNKHFAEVRLSREQARAEASETLSAVAAAEGSSQEIIDNALTQMTKIAEWTVQESELESLIKAKGFLDCVAYISDDGISVTVASAEGLSNASVAQITDIVISETDFGADQLKIVEIK